MKSQVPIPCYTGDSQEVEAQRKNYFEDRIQSGERIEPKDWMPKRYRSHPFAYPRTRAGGLGQ